MCTTSRQSGLPSAGSPSFLALLERAKRVVQDAMEHADVPFARVVEAARVPRSAAYTPVFQTMMTLQGAFYGTRKGTGDAAMSLAGLEVGDWAVRSMHGRSFRATSIDEQYKRGCPACYDGGPAAPVIRKHRLALTAAWLLRRMALPRRRRTWC